MVRKGFPTLPGDVERVLDGHGVRQLFEAMPDEAQEMYLSWIEEAQERRKRRIELLVRSLRRREV
jgi:uncharacterized protein YdeI (YjbR/CyaY-like superfamily)